MKNTTTILAALACGILLNIFPARGDMLWWTVNGDAMIDGLPSISSFLSIVPDDDLHNPAGRVKLSGGGLAEPVYLDNLFSDPETDTYYLDEGGGYLGVWIGDTGSPYYGVEYQQSHFPTELGTEMLFSIELGRMDWDDDTYMSGKFEVLAESDKYTYEMVKDHMYPLSDLNPPVTDWMPMNYYSVPEPSSSLLLLVGIGLLALRRGHGDC